MFWIVDFICLVILPSFASELVFKLQVQRSLVWASFLPSMSSCSSFLHNCIYGSLSFLLFAPCCELLDEPLLQFCAETLSCFLLHPCSPAPCFCSAARGRPLWLGSCKVQMPADATHVCCCAITQSTFRANQQMLYLYQKKSSANTTALGPFWTDSQETSADHLRNFYVQLKLMRSLFSEKVQATCT